MTAQIYHFPMDVDWISVYHEVVEGLYFLGFVDPAIKIEDSSLRVMGYPVQLIYHPKEGFSVEQEGMIIAIEVVQRYAVAAFVTRVAVIRTVEILLQPFKERMHLWKV